MELCVGETTLTVTELSVPVPTWVVRNLALKQIEVGVRHTCGVDHAGRVWCWGGNDFQQLDGTYATPDTAAPVQVAIDQAAAQVALGGFSTCAPLADGSVACWGDWRKDIYAARSPTPVVGVQNGLVVANGGMASCAIESNGIVHCWGTNNAGQLGDGLQGAMYSRDDARPVVGLPDRALGLALAQLASCALLASGQVYCWGLADNGILGNPENPGVPDEVSDLSGVVVVDIQLHACAALTDGSVKCWGDDVFLPGADGQDPYWTPVAVAGISRVVDIAVGIGYTCALTEDQEVYCWGANGHHELGLGEGSTGVDTPTRVDWRAALP